MIGTVTDLVAEALFASTLQPSTAPTDTQAWTAVTAAVATHGTDGCAAALAAAYGDCMTSAAARMRWCRDTAARLTAIPAAA